MDAWNLPSKSGLSDLRSKSLLCEAVVPVAFPVAEFPNFITGSSDYPAIRNLKIRTIPPFSNARVAPIIYGNREYGVFGVRRWYWPARMAQHLAPFDNPLPVFQLVPA